jgi:hypothetical protein
LHNVLSITCSLRGSNMRAMKGNEPPAGNEHHVEDRTLPAQKPARVQRFDETQCRFMLGHKYCLHSCKLHGVAAPGNVPAVYYSGLRSLLLVFTCVSKVCTPSKAKSSSAQSLYWAHRFGRTKIGFQPPSPFPYRNVPKMDST